MMMNTYQCILQYYVAQSQNFSTRILTRHKNRDRAREVFNWLIMEGSRLPFTRIGGVPQIQFMVGCNPRSAQGAFDVWTVSSLTLTVSLTCRNHDHKANPISTGWAKKNCAKFFLK